jgi:DNA polymerase-3 subunit epsilon
MREIVLDTESTGFDPQKGLRLVEIGCLELKNHLPTGAVFHRYMNPQREVPQDAANVHGLTYDFLKDYPLFEAHADEFLEFIQDSPLIIHNAPFDMRFLNAELKRAKRPLIPFERAICTLKMAKFKFPGAPGSLDALCKRWDIDNSNRVRHGALLDAELLASVYLELLGGRQPDLIEKAQTTLKDQEKKEIPEEISVRPSQIRPPRSFEPLESEKKKHQEMLKKINSPIWEMPS